MSYFKFPKTPHLFTFELENGSFMDPKKRIEQETIKKIKEFVETYKQQKPKSDGSLFHEELILEQFILPFYQKFEPKERALVESILGLVPITADEASRFYSTNSPYLPYILCLNPHLLAQIFEYSSVQGWRDVPLNNSFKLITNNENKAMFLNHIGIHANSMPFTNSDTIMFPLNLPQNWFEQWEIYELNSKPNFVERIKRWFFPGLLNSAFKLEPPPALNKPNVLQIPFVSHSYVEQPLKYGGDALPDVNSFTMDDVITTVDMPFGAIADEATQKNMEDLYRFHPDKYQIYKNDNPDLKSMFDEFEADMAKPEYERVKYNHDGPPEFPIINKCICHKSNCPECKVRLSLQAKINPNKNSKFYFHKK
jgi:hypothetical protein